MEQQVQRGREVALPSSQGTACTPPVPAAVEAATSTLQGSLCYPCPLGLPPVTDHTACLSHSLPDTLWGEQKGRDDHPVLEQTSCSRVLDQTLPRLNPLEIPAGLHSCNFSFQGAASATKNILVFD